MLVTQSTTQKHLRMILDANLDFQKSTLTIHLLRLERQLDYLESGTKYCLTFYCFQSISHIRPHINNGGIIFDKAYNA